MFYNTGVFFSFLVPGAEAILNIPLSGRRNEDIVAWIREKHGIYSVKSVYRALVQKKQAIAD